MSISRILQLSHQLSPDDCARVSVGLVFHYITQKGGADPAILLERYCDSLKDAWLTRDVIQFTHSLRLGRWTPFPSPSPRAGTRVPLSVMLRTPTPS